MAIPFPCLGGDLIHTHLDHSLHQAGTVPTDYRTSQQYTADTRWSYEPQHWAGSAPGRRAEGQSSQRGNSDPLDICHLERKTTARE